MALPNDGVISATDITTAEYRTAIDQVVTEVAKGVADYVDTRPYSQFAWVKASDGNTYESMVNGNIGNDPTVDDGSNWVNIYDRVVSKVESIADLSDFSEAKNEKVVIVTGYHPNTTIGGDPFVRKASGRHNGGTFIDPLRPFPTDWNDQAQVDAWFEDSGVNVAGFERVNKGSILVKWFGAKGDGSTDDSDSIQATVNSLVSQTSSNVDGVAAASVKQVKFSQGVYLVSKPVTVPSYIRLTGDKAIIEDPTKTVNLFSISGYMNYIDGFIFNKGLNAVQIVGPNVDTMVTVIDNCEFRNQSEWGVYQDISVNHGTGSANPRTGFSMLLKISNFKTYSSSLVSSRGDYLDIDGGWASFRPFLVAGATGKKYWCETETNTEVKNVLGVSVFDGVLGTDDSYWFKVGNYSKARPTGLTLSSNRFGEGGSQLAELEFCDTFQAKENAIFSRAGSRYAFVEILNKFPSIFEVNGNTGFTDNLGVLFDSDTITDLTTISDASEEMQSFSISSNDFNPLISNVHYTTRAQLFINGSSSPLINHLFQRNTSVGTNRNKSVTVYKPNLFQSGVYESSSGSMSTVSGSSNTATATDEVVSGYNLHSRVSTDGGASYGKYINSWGSSVPAGVYTLSVFVLTDKPISISLFVGGSNKPIASSIKVSPTSGGQVVEGTFYHDGSSTDFVGFNVFGLQDATTFTVGLFNINEGVSAVPYVMPFGDTSIRIPVTLYGTTPPSAGYWKVGDRMINTAPSVGQPKSWVVTSAGTPGTWVSEGVL